MFPAKKKPFYKQIHSKENCLFFPKSFSELFEEDFGIVQIDLECLDFVRLSQFFSKRFLKKDFFPLEFL